MMAISGDNVQPAPSAHVCGAHGCRTTEYLIQVQTLNGQRVVCFGCAENLRQEGRLQ